MIPATTDVTAVQPWSLAGPEARRGHEVVAQYVRRALAHYLVARPTMDTPFRLWAPDGEVPPGFVILETHGTPRPAAAPPELVPVELESDDGLMVSADWYALNDKRAPVIVLVHQSGASRGEYRQIAPRLNQMGFNALAIDSRWGKQDRWNGVVNDTARRYGTERIVASGDRARIRAIDREMDLRAAIRWVKQQGYAGPLLLWGSSITANGVLNTAASGAAAVAGVLAFSPGEYNPDNDTELQRRVERLRLPVLVACGEDEDELCGEIFDALPEGQKRYYRAPRGRHGSSILLDDPENWKPIEEFLAQFSIHPMR
jgi:dienelactone hydrolase